MTEDASFGLGRIGQIAVNIHDLERATAFYRDALGMKYLFSAGPMAFFDCDGIRLMLSAPEKTEFDHAASIIYYKVDDIKEAHERLVSRGVIFESEPKLVARLPQHDLWMAFFRDSEHNLLSILCEMPR